jgi:hypothetical protein
VQNLFLQRLNLSIRRTIIKRLSFAEFLHRARQLYGDKYDYSKVQYVNTSTKVCIICPEHGEFWMTPNNFFTGHKCPACSGRQRITKEIFISRSKKIHENRYDYSKVIYKGLNKPVTIICPQHGAFLQKPSVHLNGSGCQSCFATPKLNTEEFIRKAIEVYGNKYDYSKVVYKGNKIKVCIICPEHGEWWVTPNNHIRGSRCPGCYGTPKHTAEYFITKAREVHGSKYDYSKVEYDGLKPTVCIICPEHGEFWQSPAVHLKGHGCTECSGTKLITKEIFIQRSTEIHEGKYDYSKVKFASVREKVCIICPEHGQFIQLARYHMYGGNCPKCVGNLPLSNEEFIEKAKAVHKDRYDYSKVEYKNTAEKVCIICPEHGEFFQTPNNHLFGAGCPTCPQSNLEGEVRQFLINNDINFEQEKGFDWLTFNRRMYLDFFLPDYGIAIECQGGQHFFPSELFGGEQGFHLTVERDEVKKDLCTQHGIKILYFSNAHIKYPYPVFESFRKLLSAIKANGEIDTEQWNDQIELPFNLED